MTLRSVFCFSGTYELIHSIWHGIVTDDWVDVFKMDAFRWVLNTPIYSNDLR